MTRSRLRLASRYADLGLNRAAVGVLQQLYDEAQDEQQGDCLDAVLDGLFRIYSATGATRKARDIAAQMVARNSGPAARIRLGEAQLAIGERDAARFAFAAAIEGGCTTDPSQARALMGRAEVALQEDDLAGAGAAAMTALSLLLSAFTKTTLSLDPVSLIPLTERAITIAIAAGRGEDVDAALAGIVDDPESRVPKAFLEAIAWERSGRPEAEVASRLEQAAKVAPAFLPARLRAIEHHLRHRYRNDEARSRAIDSLRTLVHEIDSGALTVSPTLAAAVHFSLASVYEDLPGELEDAQIAYRAGILLRPGDSFAATRLANLAESRGDRETSLDSAARALTIEPDNHLAWLAAARACGAPAAVDGDFLARILEAAAPASSHAVGAVRRLVAAAIEVARADLLAGMYARGHRVKNLLGILGSRARRSRKLALSGDDNAELLSQLTGLETELTSLFDEWTKYLRSMHADGPANEEVNLNDVIADVARTARNRARIHVELSCPQQLLVVRGDQVLLREALSNLAGNAVDACETNGGSLRIAVRLRPGRGAIVEISFVDTGPGIGKANLSRVLAPGFTTKEKGSGLGLAIAERVVRAHRGRLLIDSQEGEGTRITVLLPTEMPGVAATAISEHPR